MTLTLDDAERLQGATVVDAKGEEVGALGAPHAHEGVLTGVRLEFDEAIATLPEVARDSLLVSPDYLDARSDGSVRLGMDLMDALSGHAPPGGPEARITTRLRGGDAEGGGEPGEGA